MSRGFSWLLIMVLAATALVFGALGVSHHWGERGSNLLFFGSWCAAMLMLFALGLQLPLRIAERVVKGDDVAGIHGPER